MNIEVADTSVATMVATTTTRNMAGSKAEPDPMPLMNVEDMKTATCWSSGQNLLPLVSSDSWPSTKSRESHMLCLCAPRTLAPSARQRFLVPQPPPSPQMRAGGGSVFLPHKPPPPSPQERVGGVHAATSPPLASTQAHQCFHTLLAAFRHFLVLFCLSASRQAKQGQQVDKPEARNFKYYISTNSVGGSLHHCRHLYITNSLGFHVVHQNRFFIIYRSTQLSKNYKK